MSGPQWLEDDGWWSYTAPSGWAVMVDAWPDGTFRAHFDGGGDEQACGPIRKTREAAVNDCKRYIRKLRAEMVQFSRAKL